MVATSFETWLEVLDANVDNETSNEDLASLVQMVAPNKPVGNIVDALLADETLVLMVKKKTNVPVLVDEVAKQEGAVAVAGGDGEMCLLHHAKRFDTGGATSPLYVALHGAGSRAVPVEVPIQTALGVTEVKAPEWATLVCLNTKEKVVAPPTAPTTTYYVRHGQVLPPFLHKALLTCCNDNNDPSPAALFVEALNAIHKHDAELKLKYGADGYERAELFCQGTVAYLWNAAQPDSQIEAIDLKELENSPDAPDVVEWSRMLHQVLIKEPLRKVTRKRPPPPSDIPPPEDQHPSPSKRPMLTEQASPEATGVTEDPERASGENNDEDNNNNNKSDSATKRIRTWEESFNLLKKFKETRGHCSPYYKSKDPEERTVGFWARSQRVRKVALSEDQIARLDSIGFVWEIGKRTGAFDHEKWDAMFERLKAYHQSFGTFRIRVSVDNELKDWVGVQRDQFRTNSLLESRKATLDSIGFVFNPNAPRKSSTTKVGKDKESFDGLFKRLSEYKEKNNHTTIAKGEDDELRKFVKEQRFLYARNLLEDERKNLLDSIGFAWEYRDDVFSHRLRQLRQFKEENGHLNIPEDNPLNGWCATNRYYNRLQRIKPSRKARLDELGFEWDLAKTRANRAAQKPPRNRDTPSIQQRAEKVWMKYYNQLKDFATINGHCRIPSNNRNKRVATFKSLYEWTRVQKHKHADGELDDHRKLLLDEIGFDWEIRVSRRGPKKAAAAKKEGGEEANADVSSEEEEEEEEEEESEDDEEEESGLEEDDEDHDMHDFHHYHQEPPPLQQPHHHQDTSLNLLATSITEMYHHGNFSV